MTESFVKVIQLSPFLLAALALEAQPVTPAPQHRTPVYYTIGGAAAVTEPATTVVTTVTLGASADWNAGLNCGRFDPVASLKHTLNQIASGANAMMRQLTDAATAAIGSLPALILQRANPGLYDLLQNGIDIGRHEFELATKTCELMEEEIADGKNPFEEWVVLSKADDWKVAAGIEGTDVVATKKDIATNAGQNGVVWIGGLRRGGAGQLPVRVVADTAQAGANILMGRAPHAAGAFAVSGTSGTPRLMALWRHPHAVREWATEVLGDQVVRVYDAGARESVPGNGLLPRLDRYRRDVDVALEALVSGAKPVTLDNLEAVSAPGVAMTRELIEAIQILTPVEQVVYTGKLAGEVALARTLEEALLMRRILLAGRREPNVANNAPALKQVDNALAELDGEIDNLLFETRVRREVVGETAVKLLAEAEARRTESASRAVTPRTDPNPVLDAGAVTP